MSNTGSNDPLGPIRGPKGEQGPIPVPGEGKPLPIPGIPGMPGSQGDKPQKPSAQPRPTQRPARKPGPGESDSAFDQRVRERIKAYPGTITYNDLIRKSKRDSAILIVLMVLLAAVFGASIGVIVSVIFGHAGDYAHSYMTGTTHRPADPKFDTATGGPSFFGSIAPILPAILIGGLVGLLVGGGASVWSFYGGANAILRMTHARRITKDDDPVLFNVCEEMAIAGGLPMPKIYIIDDDSLNAFATGRDPEHGVVAITRGLRAKLTRDELQGVMAHELAHIRHYDIRFSMLMATMVGLIVIVSDGFLRAMFYSGAGHRGGARVSTRGGGGGGGRGGGAAIAVIFVIAIILAVLSPIIARLLQMAYSRQREYLADAGAVELTRNPQGLASALSTLACDTAPQKETANRGTAHMYIVNPLKKMRSSGQRKSSAFCSHPPIDDRIARLLALLR